MPVKKLTVVTLFLLINTIIVQAQTKEETISWLKSKLSSYLIKGLNYQGTYTDIKLESLNECEMVITFKVSVPNYGFRYITHERIVAPTSTIKHLDGYFMYTNKGVKRTIEQGYNINSSGNLVGSVTGASKTDYWDFIPLAIDNREDNIRERVMKAFTHLATFCPTKKEVF